MAPSRLGETYPDPTQSTFTITCSFVLYDLVGGGEDSTFSPQQARAGAWLTIPSPAQPAQVSPEGAPGSPTNS